MSSPVVEDLMGKAKSRLQSTLQLYHSQPFITRILILLFITLHSFVFIFLVFVLGPEQVFNYTAQLAVYIRQLAFPKIIFICLVSLVSFPPMIGYGTLITLSGMAFGGSSQKVSKGQEVDGGGGGGSIRGAWILAASACLIGSLISFTILRSVLLTSSFGRRITRIDSLRASKQWRAMEKAIGQRGLSMVILVRFSPFPFNISNLFFASLQSVPTTSFLIATATTTPKLFLHVFIGNRLFQLFDRGARAGLDGNAKILNAIYIVVGGLMGFVASWYVYRETNKILSTFELQEEEHDAIEEGRGRHNGGQTLSTWEGGGGGAGGGGGDASSSSEERRAFLDDGSNAIGFPRRKTSANWEREGVD